MNATPENDFSAGEIIEAFRFGEPQVKLGALLVDALPRYGALFVLRTELSGAGVAHTMLPSTDEVVVAAVRDAYVTGLAQAASALAGGVERADEAALAAFIAHVAARRDRTRERAEEIFRA